MWIGLELIAILQWWGFGNAKYVQCGLGHSEFFFKFNVKQFISPIPWYSIIPSHPLLHSAHRFSFCSITSVIFERVWSTGFKAFLFACFYILLLLCVSWFSIKQDNLISLFPVITIPCILKTNIPSSFPWLLLLLINHCYGTVCSLRIVWCCFASHVATLKGIPIPPFKFKFHSLNGCLNNALLLLCLKEFSRHTIHVGAFAFMLYSVL